jgi:hypothetical protein
LLGSAAVGGIIGAIISWLRKGLMVKNVREKDFLFNEIKS